MSSSCDAVRAQLALFVGGDLEVAAADAVREHLLACLTCRNEAAGLQRAVFGLRREAVAAAPRLGEDFFASLQHDICARVAAAAVPDAAPAATRSPWRGLFVAAAAAGLALAGFLATRGGEPSVWTRPAVATPVDFGAPKAVPWAGPRVPLRLLGDDGLADEAIDDATGETQGLRARETLRNLVDDASWQLPRQRR